MAFSASLILCVAIMLIGLIAICWDPHAPAAKRVASRPTRRGFDFVPRQGNSLATRLLDERSVAFRVTGLSPDARLPRRYVIVAPHEAAAVERARQWGVHVSRIERA
jgi:hypothetical protein